MEASLKRIAYHTPNDVKSSVVLNITSPEDRSLTSVIKGLAKRVQNPTTRKPKGENVTPTEKHKSDLQEREKLYLDKEIVGLICAVT
jgi:hypothetical protein